MSNFKCDIAFNGILPKKKRILVIGDLHADYKKTKDIFFKLKLIDINLNWIASPKDTTVVQLGDQLDGGGRGHGESYGELDIISFMDNIHNKSSKYGGGVYSLIGNHEIMNLIGNFSYSSEKDIALQGGREIRNKLFSPGSKIFNEISCTRNVVLKIGDFLFVHAGVLPEHLNNTNKDNFIKKINTLMRLFLQGKKNIDDNEIHEYFLNKRGLIWTREYGGENPKCDNINKINKMLNVGHMVVGHTIQDTINSKCDNKLWRVDVGISEIFKTNKIEILEILDNGVSLKQNNYKPMRILKL